MRLAGRLLLLCALCAASGARAESLLEVYRLALQADPRLAAARLDHEASEKQKRAALAGLLPTISADAEKTTERQNIRSSQNPIIGAGFSKFPVDVWSLTVTQPIFKLSAWERLDQADAAMRQAQAQRAAAEQALMLRVASAYLGVLAAQDNLSFTTAERVALASQLKLAEERVAMGLATILNLHDARSRHSQSEAAEVEAKNTLDDAEQAMHEILGSLPKTYIALREDIPVSTPEPPNPAQWIETALKQNLGLEAKRLGAEVAQQEVRKQRAGYAPTLNLVGSYVNRKQGGTLFGGGSHVETSDLSLKLNIPFYEGGLTTALTDEAVLRHRKALHDVEAEQRAVERQARSSYLGVVGAASRVRALKQAVVSQESAVGAKQESFRSGLLTLLAVLDAQRDLYLARRDHAKARYDYLLNRLRLKQATAALAEADLEAIDRLLK
jgi:outer membrane protein